MYKPPMQGLLPFTHLAAICVYIGATVLLAILVHTMGASSDDPMVRRRHLVPIFKAYNPLAIGVLGIVVMSGAYSVTGYKHRLGADYFTAFAQGLASKLGLAFVLIFVATWLCFGICHRMVRADQFDTPTSDRELSSMLLRCRAAAWFAVALAFYTLWFSLGLGMGELSPAT